MNILPVSDANFSVYLADVFILRIVNEAGLKV